MAVTINDISKHLGVSNSTVSRALNGRHDVSEATIARVRKAADALGYHPNAAARNLRRQRTEKIGFVFNDVIAHFSDYFAEIITGATTAAEENGHNIVLYTTMGASPDGVLDLCRTREIDGLILVWNHVPAAVIDPLLDEGLPFVVLGRRVNHPHASYIAPDNYNGARALMHHLFDMGHTRIGFIAQPQLKLTHVDRLAAYRDALLEADIRFEPELVIETAGGKTENRKVTHQLLDLPNPPTAIIAFHDLIAVDVLAAIQERQLRVPNDIALAGFDGLSASLLVNPSITTVKQPLRKIGKQSVLALLDKIENSAQQPVQLTLPVQLDVRESTSSRIPI